jgi:hypothetical protein
MLDLVIIILNKISQIQKEFEKYAFSHMWTLDQKKDMKINWRLLGGKGQVGDGSRKLEIGGTI